MDLSWKHVFNCYNVFPANIYKCAEIAGKAGYSRMAFNGLIYMVNTLEHIGFEEDLDKPKQMTVTTKTTITPSPADVEFEKSIVELKDIVDKLTKSIKGGLRR